MGTPQGALQTMTILKNTSTRGDDYIKEQILLWTRPQDRYGIQYFFFGEDAIGFHGYISEEQAEKSRGFNVVIDFREAMMPILSKDEVVSLVKRAATEQLHKISADILIAYGLPAMPANNSTLTEFSKWLEKLDDIMDLDVPDTFIIKDNNGFLLLYSSVTLVYAN